MVDLEKPRFYGPNQIQGVVIQDYKTPSGGEVVKIIYKAEEGKSIDSDVVPMLTFEALVSEVPHDYNWLRENRYKILLEKLTEVALEHDVVFMDVDYLATQLKAKFAAAFDRATNLLWTGNDSSFIPGIPPLTFRTLLDAENILREKLKTDGKQG